MTLSGQEMVWWLLNDQYESYVFMDSIYSVHMNKYTFFSSFFLDISTSIGRARDIYAVSMYSMYQNMYRDQLSAGTQESLAVFVVAVYDWRLFFCHSSSPIFLLYLPGRCGRFLLLSIVRSLLGGFRQFDFHIMPRALGAHWFFSGDPAGPVAASLHGVHGQAFQRFRVGHSGQVICRRLFSVWGQTEIQFALVFGWFSPVCQIVFFLLY